MRNFQTSYLEQLSLDEHFNTEQNGIPDHRQLTSSNIYSETSFDKDNVDIIQQLINDTDEDPFQGQQNTPTEDQFEDAPQKQRLAQRSPRTQEQQTTLTIHNLSDPSDVTTINQPNLPNTKHCKFLDVPIGQITEQEGNNQQADGTSTISTSNTNITQPICKPTYITTKLWTTSRFTSVFYT